MSLTITGGTVVTPNGIIEAGVRCADGVITHIGDAADLPDAEETIDATGLLVLPGLVDPHVHLGVRPPGVVELRLEAHWESETRAAIRRGVTTLVNFHGGSPIPRDQLHVPIFKEHVEWAEQNSYVDFGFHVILNHADQVAEIEDLADLGVVGFKHFFTAYKPPVGAADGAAVGYADDNLLRDSMTRIARLNHDGRQVTAMVHAEDADLCNTLQSELMAQGADGLAAWAQARPAQACLSKSKEAIQIATETGSPLYVVHVTTAAEVDLLRELRAQGVSIAGEAVAHYLVLTADDAELGCWGKVIPALKSAKDRDALWEGLADGTLQTVGSDHCAWPRAEKEASGNGRDSSIWSAPAGMPGMEELLSVLLTYGVRAGRIDLLRLAQVCSTNPAKAFGLYPRKGAIQVGSDADLVVLDPDASVQVNEEFHHGSVTDWSAYAGRELFGDVRATVLRGRVMVRDGELLGSPGDGSYLRRSPD